VNFTPNAAVTVNYILNGSFKGSRTVSVACDGSFATSFPAGSVLGSGQITANDGSRSATKNFSIIL
jgi:hypothetical protein